MVVAAINSEPNFRPDMNSAQLHEECLKLLAEPNLIKRGRYGMKLVEVAGQLGSIASDSAKSFLSATNLSLMGSDNYITGVAKGLPFFVAKIEALQRANTNIQFAGNPIDIELCRRNHFILDRTVTEARNLVPTAFQGLAA